MVYTLCDAHRQRAAEADGPRYVEEIPIIFVDCLLGRTSASVEKCILLVAIGRSCGCAEATLVTSKNG